MSILFWSFGKAKNQIWKSILILGAIFPLSHLPQENSFFIKISRVFIIFMKVLMFSTSKCGLFPRERLPTSALPAHLHRAHRRLLRQPGSGQARVQVFNLLS